MSQTSQQVLNGYVKRIESITTQLDEFKEDVKDIYAEAKSEGFDVKALKEVIKRRKKNRADIESLEAIVETYESNITV